MSGKFTEDHVEQAQARLLEALGYGILHGPDISPDGDMPERAAYDVTILIDVPCAFHDRPHLAPTPVTMLYVNCNNKFPSLVEKTVAYIN